YSFLAKSFQYVHNITHFPEPGSHASRHRRRCCALACPNWWYRSLDHDLDLVAGIDAIVGTKPIEDAKALDRAVGDRHAARQALDRVTGCDRHDLDAQRLCRLAFRQRHATEGADRFAKGTIDLRARALGGEDEAIDVAAEPHRIEPKRPLVALGHCGRRRQP